MTADMTDRPGGDRAGAVVASVAVLTFHRPEQIVETVQQLLPQVRATTIPSGHELAARVLVVDNDPAGSGAAALREAGLDALEHVHVVVEPTPGIASARNRALDEASAHGDDVVLFMDDDGLPGADWLARMITAWQASRPAAVAGWVDTEFVESVDAPQGSRRDFVMAGGFFVRKRHPDRAELDAAACGNLLLDVHQLGSLRFSPEIGLFGGEDTLLTRQLRQAGGRIVFCRDAVVRDQVAVERVSPRWVLTRAMSHGNSAGMIELNLGGHGVADRGRLVLQGAARMGVGTVRAAAGGVRHQPEQVARGARLAARGTGMLLAGGGLAYREYARPGTSRWVPVPTGLVPPGSTTDTRGGSAVPRADAPGDGAPASAPRGPRGASEATRSRSVPTSPAQAKAMARETVHRVGGPVLGSIVSLEPTAPQVVLTFDDGPLRPTTEQFADLLESRGLRGTFFVLGTRLGRSPGLVRELHERGHEVGLHGPDHRKVSSLGVRGAREWLVRGQQELEDAVGAPVCWFRPPHGAQTPFTYMAARQLGLTPVLWSGTTWDWKDVSQAERIEKARSALRPGAVLLAHDGSADETDRASELAVPGVDKVGLLTVVLDTLDERGLRGVTVSQGMQHARAVRRISFSE